MSVKVSSIATSPIMEQRLTAAQDCDDISPVNKSTPIGEAETFLRRFKLALAKRFASCPFTKTFVRKVQLQKVQFVPSKRLALSHLRRHENQWQVAKIKPIVNRFRLRCRLFPVGLTVFRFHSHYRCDFAIRDNLHLWLFVVAQVETSQIAMVNSVVPNEGSENFARFRELNFRRKATHAGNIVLDSVMRGFDCAIPLLLR